VSVGGVGIWPSEFNSRNGLIIRNRYGIKSNPIVGFVGRADKLKGIILLIEAMRVVWNWNENVRLILAGPKPDRNGEVARCLNELKFEDRARIVEIHDFSENDKASIYDAFDVFVLPSIAESFGIAYLEAWMCQKPVIGGRIGSTQSVIQENVDGLLVDPGNSKELADKIIHLLRDQNLQNTMGKAGYAKTMKYHTWEKVTDRVEHIYRSVVDLQGRVAQAKTSLRF
jgi:glycosyltransferase involved in cell wall biosynthesis